jgi:hypothetical protein
MDKLLKSSDVAKYLDVSVRSVHRLCAQGKLAFVRISPKEKRFTQNHLEEFISRQTEEARECLGRTSLKRQMPRDSVKGSQSHSVDALRKKMKSL